jgi:hypothetical protein
MRRFILIMMLFFGVSVIANKPSVDGILDKAEKLML